MKSVLLLYPHQLYPVRDLPKVDTVVIVEEPLYFGMDQEFPMRYHKQKLILHRASMRRYVEEVLWPADIKTEYIDLDVFMQTGDVFSHVGKADQVYVIDPTDNILSNRLLQARRERPELPSITFLPSPNFYLKEHEVREYFSTRHKHPFGEFYQWQRERFNILIDDSYKPVGGKWTFAHKPQKLPQDMTLPSFGVFGDNQYVTDAVAWVEEHFPNNPGSTDFIWPTNHKEAETWLQDFLEHRLDNFGVYLEAIDPRSPWLFHSLLSSSLNIGLLKPQEVVHATLARHAKQPVDLANLEAFVRQVLGWREYMRGYYLHQRESLQLANVFNHNRKLTSAWYNGTTGLPPLDDLIKKVHTHGYAHQAEGVMIAGNLMILAEIHPDQIYKWFNELLIDSVNWQVIPSVVGLHQLDGKGFENQPAISPSNTILEISNYERGDWSDIWDGLFWRFIEKHQAMLGHNPSLRVMVQRMNRLDADRKRIIHYRAEDFLNQHTKI